MANRMMLFMVAVSGTSLVCYLLMNRAQSRKIRREGVSDGTYSGTGGGNSSGDGWSLFSWGGSDSSSHDSGSSSDGGGGGGDGGGGGGD